MAEYIDKEVFLDEIRTRRNQGLIGKVEAQRWGKIVKTFPAADVVERKRDATQNALEMVREERERQNSIWGDQSGNHPFEWMSILGEEYGELCEAVNETCFQNGKHPERGGSSRILKEAVQVAAVAVAIIEATLQKEAQI